MSKRLTKKELEEQNKQLLEEIFILVEDKEFIKVAEIKSKYLMKIAMEKAMWYGATYNVKMPLGTPIM